MAIATSNSATVSGNVSSDWVRLREGENSVSITSDTWGGSTTAALEKSDDGTEDTMSPCKIGTEAISLTGNDRFIVDGPGYVRITVANYSGSDPITIARYREPEQW